MPEDNEFRENIKKSFQNVKDDIKKLKEDTEFYNEKIEEIKQNSTLLSEKIDRLLIFFEKNENKPFFYSSSGNKGVVNNLQQSTTVYNNDQQSSTMNDKQSTTQNTKTLRKDLEKINEALTFKFKSLTDRELSVFIAIHDIEMEKNEVSYADIANKLNVTEPTVRGNVNRLLQKGLPVEKERFFNKKASLYISKDFKNLNLLTKIIELRKPSSIQKTLLDL